jgi:hypothetical protein
MNNVCTIERLTVNVARLFSQCAEFRALPETERCLKVANRVRLLLEIRELCQ